MEQKPGRKSGINLGKEKYKELSLYLDRIGAPRQLWDSKTFGMCYITKEHPKFLTKILKKRNKKGK